MSNQPIIGHYGCHCHPFESATECWKMHRQKFNPGDKVKDRCDGRTGVITQKLECGFYEVKFGNLPRDLNQRHPAQLIKL